MEAGVPADRRWWRSSAGSRPMFDAIGACQFSLLTLFFGLREKHMLLEIGTGPMRAGRLLVHYLDVGHYFGIEPNKPALERGLKYEVGDEIVAYKKPRFLHCRDYGFDGFGEQFDRAVSFSVLSHAPPGDVVKIFANLAKCFHEGSIFLCTALLRDKETIVDPDKWTTRPCNEYSFDRIQDCAQRAGMRAERLGQTIYQDWFVSYFPGNEIAMRGAEETRKVHWQKVIPKFERPPEWADGFTSAQM